MPDRHGDHHHNDHQQQHSGYAGGVIDPELAAILDDIVGPDGASGAASTSTSPSWRSAATTCPQRPTRSPDGSSRSPPTNSTRRSTTTPSREPGWS